MSWPYPFTIGDVMERGAELARRYEERKLRELAALPKPRRMRQSCSYCGQKAGQSRACPSHQDLLRLDPMFILRNEHFYERKEVKLGGPK